ncbi:hypothetical protein AXE80_09720 [Wenyingzhuangia fucanilytica]|uniref:DoxX-like family protein n=2 Tax=Wenyingzhuangia fucanilytica TaxID=1790137 RepID=A0A1B1Y9N3_9FLAO|nr:hypothetical protein AXE80_09720 [Wenyingzhuangia fucanilytica]
MYFFNHEQVSQEFINLGFPLYIIYPLGVLKIAGVIVLLTQKQSSLKDWVYSAMFFNALLAGSAHVVVNDGEQMGAIIALILILSSFFLGKKLYSTKK